MAKCGICLHGGTGQQPSDYQQYGAIISGAPYGITFQLCHPVPDNPFPDNSTPPVTGCDIYTRNLDNYPLNQATTHQNGFWIFGKSEMAVGYVVFKDYPRSGGNITFNWKNPQGQIVYTWTGSLPVPDPNWTWWWTSFWSVIGKFDHTSGFSGDEIIAPGTYLLELVTPWGTGKIDFQVTGTGIVQPPTTDQYYILNTNISGQGLENAAILINGKPAMTNTSVPAGNTARIEALVSGSTKFTKWTIDGSDNFQNPLNLNMDHNTVLTGYFEVSTLPPVVPVTITYEIRNTAPATGNLVLVFKNGVYYDSTKNLSYFDFNIGDTISLRADAISGWEFVKFTLNGVDNTTNPDGFVVPENGGGVITVYWKELQDTSGYVCADNCQNRVLSGAQYKTQAECQAGCVVEPPPIDSCPRGEKFRAGPVELLAGCPDGYSRPLFNDYCICDESQEGKTWKALWTYGPIAVVGAWAIGQLRGGGRR